MADEALGIVLGGLALLLTVANAGWSLFNKLGSRQAEKTAEMDARITSLLKSVQRIEKEAARSKGARIEERLSRTEEEQLRISNEIREYGHDLEMAAERLQTVQSLISDLRRELGKST